MDDLLDASSAAIEFADKSTRVVYPLVRTAFEAAQRIVALASDDDYLRVGTRAWLYYQHQDASVRRKTDAENAERWLGDVVSRMCDIWAPHNREAEQLLAAETANLKAIEKKRPDNFMGRDLAGVVQDRYQTIFGPAGISDDVRQLNRGIYAALTRDSHARLRIEPAAMTIRPNGTVRVIPRRVDDAARRRTLLHCLESSLTEALAAVSYFLEARSRADIERVRSMAAHAPVSDLPAGFSPDLGLTLARGGGAETAFHFSNVPIRKLGILPDGTACWSANIALADREYVATFDVPATLSSDLADVIGLSLATLAPGCEIVRHNLDPPRLVSLESTLGEIQRNGNETFVPLVVKRLAPAEA